MMNPKEALIHAAFKGLAEGLMAAADVTPPEKVKPRVRLRRGTKRNQPGQSQATPQMKLDLQGQFEAPDYRGPERQPAPTVQDLDAMFRGGGEMSEQQEAFLRQLRMQETSAKVNPPPQPPGETAMAWNRVPDSVEE